jgi:hypothetical protein
VGKIVMARFLSKRRSRPLTDDEFMAGLTIVTIVLTSGAVYLVCTYLN